MNRLEGKRNSIPSRLLSVSAGGGSCRGGGVFQLHLAFTLEQCRLAFVDRILHLLSLKENEGRAQRTSVMKSFSFPVIILSERLHRVLPE